MQRFWDLVTEGVLVDRKPRRIVEIGSQAGTSTLKLLTFARDNAAFVDVIDPLAPLNLPDLEAFFPDCGAFHQGPSLEVLPTIPVADVYFIDGDHNWYTVYHELTAIMRAATAGQHRAPLIILHDVGWPYGRRDLYYDPSTIPEEFRQPHQQGGLRVGESSLTTDGGLNHHLHHAVQEGGPRNGVRTAIEDFMEDRPGQYRYHQSDAFNGLGFLVPAVDQRHPYASRVARFCEVPTGVRPLVDALEGGRIAAMTTGEDFRWQRDRTQEALQAAQHELRRLQGQVRHLETVLAQIRATRGFRGLEAMRGVVRRFRKLR